MEINRIKIDGYKNLNKIDLKLNDINALISQNNYGKSNVIAAIEFAIDFIKKDKQAKSRMINYKGLVPNNKYLANRAFSFLIELQSTKDVVEYSYSFAWGSKDNVGKVKKEMLRIKENSYGSKYTTYMNRDFKSATYLPSTKGRCDKKISIENRDLLINKLLAYDNLFYINIIKEINKIKIYVDQESDFESFYAINYLRPKNSDEVIFVGRDNVIDSLNLIKNKHPNKFRLIINVFKELFANIEDVFLVEMSMGRKYSILSELPEDAPFTIPDKISHLYFKDKNMASDMEFSSLSTGAKRIFLLLIQVVMAEINKSQLICFEEVENYIHPGLLNKFIKTIEQLKSDTLKIIFSTHSPYIVQYMKLDQIFIGKPNYKGLSSFYKIKPTNHSKLLKTADLFNMSIGEYLFDQINGEEEEVKELVNFLED